MTTHRSASEPRPVLYLLADHLDAALAAGEDLVKLAAGAEPGSDVHTALPSLVKEAQTLEFVLISRTLQARHRFDELPPQDAAISAALDLLAAATAPLADAFAGIADTVAQDFDAGQDPLAYLRSRGVIASDEGGLPLTGQVAITEDFLVAKLLPLGPLMDMIASGLDLLDAVHGLYDTADASAAPVKSAA